MASLSSRECVFLATESGTAHAMTLQVLHALDQCREFRPLDEQVSRIEATIPELANSGGHTRRQLEGLLERNLLVRDDEFLANLRKAPEREPPALRAVFIRACDRPQRLAFLLTSLIKYENQHRARHHYVLIDDSTHPDHARTQRKQLDEFARATGCRISYFGHEETSTLAETLCRAHPRAREAIHNLLVRGAHPQSQRFGGGRSRNIALLLSAGARLILLDDDLCLPLRRPGFASSGLDPKPGVSARAQFLPSMEQALACGDEIEEDPFALHLDVCGQALGARTRGAYELSRDALRGLSLEQLALFKADARILSTHHGSYGSSRSESTLWLYHALDSADREEFWSDGASYERNLHAHFVLYASSQAHVLEVPGFTPFALDNSIMLPCTNPVGRAEDSLGGALTRYCHPDSISLELPMAVGHVQESLRARFPITREARPPRFNDFLREFVRRQFGLFKSRDPGQRLNLLAEVVRELSTASVEERLHHLAEFRLHVHADMMNRLQRQLDTAPSAPTYWQSDVRDIINAHARALLSDSKVPRLAEWPLDLDKDGCAQTLSTEFENFALACEHWPALWQHAAECGAALVDASG